MRNFIVLVVALMMSVTVQAEETKGGVQRSKFIAMCTIECMTVDCPSRCEAKGISEGRCEVLCQSREAQSSCRTRCTNEWARLK